MPNLLDYLAWRGDLSFDASPFNEVDNLVFSMLAFVDFSDLVPARGDNPPIKLSACSEAFFARYPEGIHYGALVPAITNDLFRNAAATTRFGDVYMSCYRDELDEEKKKQFSAITFILPDNTLFLAFRGTDDTLVGWHEDFQLSFLCPTPSQEAAAAYVNEIGSLYRGDMYLGGHSKGGNLALYGAVYCDPSLHTRIRRAYSNDGPGFTEEVLANPQWKKMHSKLLTLLPESSLVGMLLEHSGPYEVIRSTQPRFLQHNPFSWEVCGPKFEHLPALSKKAVADGERIRRFLSQLSTEERQKFTELLFHVLESSNAKTLTDLTENSLHSIQAMIRSFQELPIESKQQMFGFVRLLATAGNDK